MAKIENLDRLIQLRNLYEALSTIEKGFITNVRLTISSGDAILLPEDMFDAVHGVCCDKLTEVIKEIEEL